MKPYTDTRIKGCDAAMILMIGIGAVGVFGVILTTLTIRRGVDKLKALVGKPSPC